MIQYVVIVFIAGGCSDLRHVYNAGHLGTQWPFGVQTKCRAAINSDDIEPWYEIMYGQIFFCRQDRSRSRTNQLWHWR